MAGSVIPLTDHEAYFALGDGDFSQEWEYVHEFSTEIALYPKRIWKVGHHGSKFSSDSGFLKELNPSAFWISVGKHNHYHHPHPLTMERLHELQVPIYRTDEDGDLVEYISHPFFSKRS